MLIHKEILPTNMFYFLPFFCNIFRPLFCGETSVEQLVDIVSLIGPITYDDLETVQIDKSRYICYPKEMQYIGSK